MDEITTLPVGANEQPDSDERTPFGSRADGAGAGRRATRPGLRFREGMHGYMSADGDDFETAYRRGRTDESRFACDLTIVSDDLPLLLRDPSHAAAASGTVLVPDLSPKPLQVSGTFQMFEVDPTSVETTRMWYRLELTAADGRVYDFEGHKVIHDKRSRDIWANATTVFFTVKERGQDQIVARGIARVGLAGLVRLLRTLEVTGVAGATDQWKYRERFAAVFLRMLWRTYARALELAYDFRPAAQVPTRPLTAPQPERHDVRTRDGARVRLTRYHGGDKGPVLMAPGFGVTADSFATPTVPENLVERLTAEGYDVWLFDYRASPVLLSGDSRAADFSIDDVVDYDWPDAVAYVRNRTGADTVQVVVHCVGSMTFLMAMTQGLQGVRSAVCSQLTLHAPTNLVSRLKATLRVADVFQRIGLRLLDSEAQPTGLDKGLDLVLRLNPVLRGERCHNPVCRRIFAIFGPSYRHDQLDEATHRQIHAWFGRSSVSAFRQLSSIVRHGVAVDRRGRNRYLPHVDAVRIPILFLAGEENREFYPSASALTVRALQEVNDRALYTREVIPGYGHMDCFIGHCASSDIFPRIVKHLDAHPSERASRGSSDEGCCAA